MPATIEEHSNFWEEKWKERTEGEKVRGNQAKLHILVMEILSRGCFGTGQKLDIGCGPALHAYVINQMVPSWVDSWTGIDLSETAIAKAKSFDLNAFVADIYEYTGNGTKYDVFLLLDTLEHLFDHERLGQKIRALGAKEYTIFGNVPLYLSESEGFERAMDVTTVARFLEYAGCEGQVMTKVYGINSRPYLLFEASNSGKVRDRIVETVKSISSLYVPVKE